MLLRLAADAVLLVHFAFIAFVVAGGLLVLRWRWLAALHLPAAAWGVFIELTGRLCPLTDWENALRKAAGESGYAESFIEHYLLPVIYPAGLTRGVQFALAAVVLGVNVAVYGWILIARRAQRGKRGKRDGGPPVSRPAR
jgi:hypothetical protein